MKSTVFHPVHRYQPFMGMSDIFDQVLGKNFAHHSVPAPLNIKEKADAFEVEVAAPGLKKENFHIEIENNMLKISAELTQETEKTQDKYTTKEFQIRAFQRHLKLSENIDTENISATYIDGILNVRLAKKSPEQSKNTRSIVVE